MTIETLTPYHMNTHAAIWTQEHGSTIQKQQRTSSF